MSKAFLNNTFCKANLDVDSARISIIKERKMQNNSKMNILPSKPNRLCAAKNNFRSIGIF